MLPLVYIANFVLQSDWTTHSMTAMPPVNISNSCLKVDEMRVLLIWIQILHNIDLVMHHIPYVHMCDICWKF